MGLKSLYILQENQRLMLEPVPRISAGLADSNVRYRLDSSQTVDAEADLSLIVMFIFAGDPASDAGACTGDQCCT